MRKMFALLGLGFLMVVVVAMWQDYNREWKKYQRTFYQKQRALAATEKERQAVEAQPLEIKSDWLREINRVDRCATCHLAIEDPRFKDAPQPFKTHPAIPAHPFDKFGCTLCHQGQGRATSAKAAHGNVEHWLGPLLKGPFLQSACARCHDPLKVTGAPILTQGARMFAQLGCPGCHKVAGRGGDVGPDLTKAGKFALAYLRESLVDPKANDPNSIMPPFKLPEEQLQALLVYLVSLRGERPLPGFIPEKEVAAAAPLPPKPEERPVPAAVSEEDGKALFAKFNCPACHKVGEAGGIIGPELTHIARTRDDKWLFAWLKDPQATKPGATMPNLNLSDADAQAIVKYLVTLK